MSRSGLSGQFLLNPNLPDGPGKHRFPRPFALSPEWSREMEKKKRGEAATEILDTLGDFTSKENWDKFFAARGSGDSFEWYAEWTELRDPLLAQLKTAAADPLQILVPGCGSSRVSEYLYDAGFRCTTNIDFSKVVVSDMLRRYVRSRPEMRWRVMDMTELQVLMPLSLSFHLGLCLKYGAGFPCFLET